jgi:flagellar biosynthesis protein FlhB
MNGLKRIFGIQAVVELIKAIVKTVLVGLVAWNLYGMYHDDFMGLSTLQIDQAIYRAGDIITHCLLILSVTLIVVVALDVPYQLWHHHEQLKMTKQEVRDEAKDQEGNPEVKGKIRQMQMQAAASKLKRTNYLPTQHLLDANVHVWMHQHAKAKYGKRMNVACRQQNPRPPYHSPTYSYYANHYA